MADNRFCADLTFWRSRRGLPRALRPLTQTHAWWHLLSGWSGIMQAAFIAFARLKYLGHDGVSLTPLGGWRMERVKSQ